MDWGSAPIRRVSGGVYRGFAPDIPGRLSRCVLVVGRALFGCGDVAGDDEECRAAFRRAPGGRNGSRDGLTPRTWHDLFRCEPGEQKLQSTTSWSKKKAPLKCGDLFLWN